MLENHEDEGESVVLEPDINTIRNWEWVNKTALLIADPLYGKKRIACGPRSILKKQIQKLEKKGYKTSIGAVIDFYIFKETYEKLLEKDSPISFTSSSKKQMMHSSEKQQLFINDIITASIRSGLPLTSIEYGKDEGQLSAQFSATNPLILADTLTLFKKVSNSDNKTMNRLYIKWL